MLNATATKPETITVTYSYGCDYTTLELQNRKDGRRVDLKIWSRIPLSMSDVRKIINDVLGDRWQWRQLNATAEYCPF